MRIRISRSILWIIRLARMGGRDPKGGGSCVYWEACIVQMGWELGDKVSFSIHYDYGGIRKLRGGPENRRNLQRVALTWRWPSHGREGGCSLSLARPRQPEKSSLAA
jgi:hypothetical protein